MTPRNPDRRSLRSRTRALIVGVALVLAVRPSPAGQAGPPEVLPPLGTSQLARSLEAAAGHARHLWRDTPPRTGDGDVNAYIEISRGDRRKWEYDMRTNARAIDRVIPEDIGGYPINYGFVPQTVSYDGDPFDVLVLGPPLTAGQLVQGRIVGLMYMEDEKGLDSKVVLSPVGADGRTRYELTDEDRQSVAEYFRKYKRGEPGKFSKVPGWGSAEEGRAYVTITHRFFNDCRTAKGAPCLLGRRAQAEMSAGGWH